MLVMINNFLSSILVYPCKTKVYLLETSYLDVFSLVNKHYDFDVGLVINCFYLVIIITVVLPTMKAFSP